MRLLLHIGTYKTGTSSLQHTLRNNESILVEHGVFYPKSPSYRTVNQHSELVEWISSGEWGLVENFILDITAEAKTKKCNTIVLSSEAFSSLSKPQLVSFKGYLNFTSIDVICYFRNIFDYTVSTLCQLLKMPNQNLFSGKIIHQLQRRLDYDQILDQWIGAGFEVKVLNYETEKNELLASMLKELELSSISAKLVLSKNRNVGFSLFQMINLSLSGAIKSHSDHEKIHRLYFGKHGGIKIAITPEELKLSSLIVGMLNLKYIHPLLAPIKKDLLETRESSGGGVSQSLADQRKLLDTVEGYLND